MTDQPTVVTEYKLLASWISPEHLSGQVNEHLRQGWALHGSSSVSKSTGVTVFAQAVTIWRMLP